MPQSTPIDDLFDAALRLPPDEREAFVESCSSDPDVRARLAVLLDSHEEALNAGPHALKLCEMIDASDDWECECDEIMDKFAAEVGRRPIYTVCFY